jgi:hypothetical protein
MKLIRTRRNHTQLVSGIQKLEELIQLVELPHELEEARYVMGIEVF